MDTQRIKIKDLHPNTGQIPGLPANPRSWTKAEVQKIARSLRETPELFEARPIIVYPQDGEFVILGGNLRYEGCKANKEKDAPCFVIPEGTPVEKLKEIVIKDNGSFGEWDYDALANLWDDLPLTDWGVPAWNTDETGVIGAIPPEVQEDDFNEETDEIHIRCQPGDIWQLGDHRLMCGDSTNQESVKKLMGGMRSDISVTSPPYGVNDGGLRAHKEAGNNEYKPKNFYNEYKDGQEGWRQLMDATFDSMIENSDQIFINVQLLADNKRELMQWAASHADRLIDILIWDKGHAAPQMQPNIVNNNYEFIFVYGDRNASRKLLYGEFKGNKEAILRIAKGQNEFSGIHNAVFPIELPAEILSINSKADSVLDLFGGTGTTMMACEQLGRKCYMMELDPHYCDIILARWEKLTGREAVKVE